MQPDTARRYERHVMRNYPVAPLTLVRGAGTQVWDDTGKAYLDFTSGIAVNAVGHAHPRWLKALHEQASTLVHCSNLFRHPRQAELAERLCEYAGEGRVFFCNSGAEANEALIKLARLHGRRLASAEGQRYRILCAKNAFHGRTFGGMSATPQEKIQGGFRPMLDGFAFGELNHLESFAALVDDTTCAILIETIQGEGGIHACTTAFLKGLRALCDQHGLLLLLDEVQCGIGRSGRFYAFEHHGITPDAIGMAKGLGGGFPIGAVWTSPTCHDLFTPGTHGTTFGGTPLACAAALATLDILRDEQLIEHIAKEGPPWIEALRTLPARYPHILQDIRGIGFMVGLQLTRDPAPVAATLRELGLLVPTAGGNVIRLLPPLTTSGEELAQALHLCEQALAAHNHPPTPASPR